MGPLWGALWAPVEAPVVAPVVAPVLTPTLSSLWAPYRPNYCSDPTSTRVGGQDDIS